MLAHELEAKIARLRLARIEFKGRIRELLLDYLKELEGEGHSLDSDVKEDLLTITEALDDSYSDILSKLERDFEDAVSNL